MSEVVIDKGSCKYMLDGNEDGKLEVSSLRGPLGSEIGT